MLAMVKPLAAAFLMPLPIGLALILSGALLKKNWGQISTFHMTIIFCNVF